MPSRTCWLALVLPLALTAGCSQFIDPNVPEPIRPYVDPEFGNDYLFYRPSRYDRQYTWPLIVACHASLGDSPNKRIRAWTQLAEQYGFLVVAPKLSGVASLLPPNVDEQRALQRRDEDRILAAIRHVRAGHNVSEDRIFIHAWSGGAYAALHTGLRHPDVFRAIALSQPRFDETFVDELASRLDRNQPIYVNYSSEDVLTGTNARRCVDWLRANGAKLIEEPFGPVTALHTERPTSFFKDMVRTTPWLHISAVSASAENSLQVRLKTRSSFAPIKVQWTFGDGESAAGANPIHAYAKPGMYTVTLTANDENSTTHRRSAAISVPALTVRRINTPGDPSTTP